MDYDFEDIEDLMEENLFEVENEVEHIEGSEHKDEITTSLEDKIRQKLGDTTFVGVKYTDAEIDRMESDVDMAQSEVSARRADVLNWESKVSLNDTKEHRANGDYANAVNRLNEAKSRYNTALDRLNDAQRKLNNAR